ncbi:hypothetical protein Cni_G25729 [Canna indica]|uniref:Uncharacterized protein n=1 Tax=Canna indica TaxID=4628 RepID=A0AAQ3QLB6_9LILI|nr:hypothetical protein Cni_G25729 [Canna indica]
MAGEEDEVISSECISGSQSGWTSYLNHSSCNSPLLLVHNNGHSSSQEQEEDLSMVSDASSKPPHFHVEEDEQYCNCSPWLKQDGGKKRRLEPKQGKDHLSSLLDDTASSKASLSILIHLHYSHLIHFLHLDILLFTGSEATHGGRCFGDLFL